MNVNYYGSRLSPHIIKNSDGFLICKDVPIARTGTQKYLAREIGFPERGNEIVTVYRTDEEVFAKKAIDSYNGVPFVNEHPSDFVNPLNVQNLIKGSVTNVRRGTGQNSDLLLADIVVYGNEEIDEIIDKLKREISCGYSCSYVKFRDGYKQVDIVGNHVALVSAGRAGNRVAIQDTAETTQNKKVEGVKKKMSYRIPRKSKITDFVNAVGLKTLAADAEPEEVQEMVSGLVEEQKQAEKDAEPIVIEPEVDTTKDEEIEQLKSEIAATKDAIYALLTADEEVVEETVEEEDEECGTESLDALEEEFKEAEDEDVQEQIAEVEESPEKINEDSEEEELTTDSILELSKVLKPIIASVPDKEKRKQMSDSLATVLRKHAKKAQDSKKDTNYSKMLNRTTDSSVNSSNVDYGMMIAQQFNPHYKEEK